MSAVVDEIMSYKKNPDEDFYALLNCDESSSVSLRKFIVDCPLIAVIAGIVFSLSHLFALGVYSRFLL
jgi:hypothetical protein